MPVLRLDRLESVQKGLGISNRELARRTRFSTSYISEIKSGKKEVSGRFMDALCEVFQSKYDALFIHPSIKLEESSEKRWYDKVPKKLPSRLCSDPEHGSNETLTVKEERQLEKGVAELIPKQTRKRFWGLKFGREIRLK